MIFEAGYETSLAAALFAMRVLAGVLFFAQGYDKLFVLGIRRAMEPFVLPFIRKNIPENVLYLSLLLSSVIEFSGGLLLITGFMRDYSIYLLLLNMLGVAVGFCLLQPVWDMQFYFPRFILLVVILLLPPEWDLWRLDVLMK